MELHVLVHIQRIKFLAVKSREEHTNHQTKVKRLHIRFLFLHAEVDVVIIGTEIFSSETGSIHFVVVIHDSLQFICFSGTLAHIASGVHAGKCIVLTAVCCIGKDCSDTNLRLEALEYLIVTDKHGY